MGRSPADGRGPRGRRPAPPAGGDRRGTSPRAGPGVSAELDLAGNVAIVTGAGRGLGRAEALELAGRGATVIVNDLGVTLAGEKGEEEPADQVVREIEDAGGKAAAHFGDVSDFQQARELIQFAIEQFGDLHVLVNNAGILRDRMVFNMSEEEWDIVIAVHLKGHFSTIKPAGVIFRQQRSG